MRFLNSAAKNPLTALSVLSLSFLLKPIIGASLVPKFELIIIIVFLKSLLFPLASLSVALSKICKNIFKSSG